MAFIAIPNCVQVELIFTQFSQRMENVFHVSTEATIDATFLQGVATVFSEWWSDNLQASVSNTVSLILLVLKDLTSQQALSIEVPVSPAAVGGGTGGAAPSNVTFAVKWTTAQRGRSYRGRTYHIGLTEDYFSGNQLLSTPATTLTTKYNALITACNTASFPLVVASRFANGSPRTSGVTTPIVTAQIDLNLDSQRRRLTGRGQ